MPIAFNFAVFWGKTRGKKQGYLGSLGSAHVSYSFTYTFFSVPSWRLQTDNENIKLFSVSKLVSLIFKHFSISLNLILNLVVNKKLFIR